jgi:hypothetical protein
MSEYKFMCISKFKGITIPIYLGDLDGCFAITKASKKAFDCGDGVMSKYQMIIDIKLFKEDNEFIKYIFHHELGHIDIFLKYLNNEFDFTPSGTFKEELYCDMYSLKAIGRYDKEFIDYLRGYEKSTELQRMINKYIVKFIDKGIFENIDNILKVNFECVEDAIYAQELIDSYLDDMF